MRNTMIDPARPAVRAVVFDVGGVLARTDDHGPRERLAASLGLSEAALHDAVFDNPLARSATLGTVGEAEVWALVARRFKLNPSALADFQSQFWAGDRFDFSLARWLGALRPRVRTGLLSNAWSNARDAFLTQYQVYRFVDAVVISAEQGVAKPDPAIYAICARQIGAQPADIVFVDDVQRNIDAAEAAGMRGVLFQSPGQTIAAVERLIGRG